MYLDISLQLKKNCIIYLTGIVEVNSPKRKVWIMGVCDWTIVLAVQIYAFICHI